MTQGKGYWKALSGISFVISSIVLGLGLDKMFRYDSGETYPYDFHNAYVGGDAYNYIINGNYATGFFVLATMFAVMGVGFVILYYLSRERANSCVPEKTTNEADTMQISLRKKLLVLMVHTKENILGDIEFQTANYSFYQFVDKIGLEKDVYETLLKDMRHENLISINLNGYETFEGMIISATENGARYLQSN